MRRRLRPIPVLLGVKKENITLVDHVGVVFQGRKKDMTEEKAIYAQDTEIRDLGEAIKGADVFLGLSAGGILKPEMVKAMAAKPFILALANPDPEILPEVAFVAGAMKYGYFVRNAKLLQLPDAGAFLVPKLRLGNQRPPSSAWHELRWIVHSQQSFETGRCQAWSM